MLDITVFHKEKVASWSDHDCETYLKLALELKNFNEGILSRCFENLGDIVFVKDNIDVLFFDNILK